MSMGGLVSNVTPRFDTVLETPKNGGYHPIDQNPARSSIHRRIDQLPVTGRHLRSSKPPIEIGVLERLTDLIGGPLARLQERY